MNRYEFESKRDGRKLLRQALAGLLLTAGVFGAAYGADHVFHDHKPPVTREVHMNEPGLHASSSIHVIASPQDLDPGIDSLEVPLYIREIEQKFLIKYKVDGNTVPILGGRLSAPTTNISKKDK